jgi:hypothetical protein
MASVVERLALPKGAHRTSYLDRLKNQATDELVKAIDKRVHERALVG